MLQMYSQWCKSPFCASALTDPLQRIRKQGLQTSGRPAIMIAVALSGTMFASYKICI